MPNETQESPALPAQDSVPLQTSSPGNSASHEPMLAGTNSSAGLIVLQWMTYILWLGVLITLGILLTAALRFFVLDNDSDQTYVVYLLAVQVCLLPFALLADRFYAQREPQHKQGFAAFIMAVHAVLAFIVALSASITAVNTALSILIETGPTGEKVVVIVSSLIITALSGLFFVRVLRPERLLRASRLFPFAVLAISSLALVFTLIGPFMRSIETRDDRLIEQSLPVLNNEIQSYVNTNGRLPARLQDLASSDTFDTSAKLLINRNLVSYRILKEDTKPRRLLQNPDKPISPDSVIMPVDPRDDMARLPQYELCVTYKRAKNADDVPRIMPAQDRPVNYIDSYAHKAGRQCYTLQAYANSYDPGRPEPMSSDL